MLLNTLRTHASRGAAPQFKRADSDARGAAAGRQCRAARRRGAVGGGDERSSAGAGLPLHCQAQASEAPEAATPLPSIVPSNNLSPRRDVNRGAMTEPHWEGEHEAVYDGMPPPIGVDVWRLPVYV
jgi:hypothetical protein